MSHDGVMINIGQGSFCNCGSSAYLVKCEGIVKWNSSNISIKYEMLFHHANWVNKTAQN